VNFEPLHQFFAKWQARTAPSGAVRGQRSEMGTEARQAPEKVDSFAPAHLKLVRFPARSSLPSRLYLDHSHCPCLRQLPWLRCRLPARLKLVCFPAHSPATHRGFAFYVAFPKRSIPSLATCSMSLFPKAPFVLRVCPSMSLDSARLHSRAGGRGRQLLFDLRQNTFHLFFAERAHGLGLDVSQ
jgi:hypothetical protein